MNKAFVREPEFDGRAYCPACKSLGEEIGVKVLDAQILPAERRRIGTSGWFCPFPTCEIAYFDLLGAQVPAVALRNSVYPKDPSAPLCACFGFDYDDLLADVADDKPMRIRELLAKSQTAEARCAELAANGQCCMREVQRLYMRLRQSGLDSPS